MIFQPNPTNEDIMPRPLHIAIVMDPIESIKPEKDSTFAMLLAIRHRGHHAHLLEPQDLWMADGKAMGRAREVTVTDQKQDYFRLEEETEGLLTRFDRLLMRKDPPFDMEYIYTTYLLEAAEEAGLWVINRPRSLRDVNEKAFTARFPQCCPPTLISRERKRLRSFLEEQGSIVVKPLDGMGGASIFRIDAGDPNTSVILETMTRFDQCTIVAQRFLPEYVEGDKRILLIHGEPVPLALARIPAAGEARANLAAGGHGIPVPLTERDRWICQEIAPELIARGLDFVGLDVIGDYLTEINVTSPTGIRELDRACSLDIAGQFIRYLEQTKSR